MSKRKPPQPVGSVVCVLFHHPDHPPSAALCRALAGRGIDVRPCTDRFAALQALCASSSEAGVGLSILLFSEPGDLPGIAELATLSRVYVPRSVRWMYTSGPTEQVREVRESDVVAWGARESGDWRAAPDSGGTVVGFIEPSGKPTLRIVHGEGPGPDRGGSQGVAGGGPGLGDREEAGANDEPVLTDEELSMLLSDDFEDPDDGGARR